METSLHVDEVLDGLLHLLRMAAGGLHPTIEDIDATRRDATRRGATGQRIDIAESAMSKSFCARWRWRTECSKHRIESPASPGYQSMHNAAWPLPPTTSWRQPKRSLSR
ncbi:hypothetical protein [Xanthomonas oryzae]|uniref:hypothetical protein n=1 Tax=Xanthomonas oryzae TaxID=347 RepID=UPI000A599D34|nr:hypothetical protein [Xanthomonas oryzae]